MIKLTIKTAENGYIMTGRFGDSNSIMDVIIERKDNEEDDLACMQSLLYQVKEYFGIFYSKHNAKNLVISIKEREKD